MVILIAGIFAMAQGVFASGESRRLLPFAFGSACATAGYSIVDGLGARIAGDAQLVVAWMFMLDLAFLMPAAAIIFGRLPLPTLKRDWGAGAIAATASYVSYAVAVWAMTLARTPG